jgi:hypothetical protein
MRAEMKQNRSRKFDISYRYETNPRGRLQVKLIAILLFLSTMALSTVAQTETAPSQYSKPTGEPVPQSSTLENAPPAPALPADWTKQLTERHESIVSDHLRIHVFRLRPGDDLLASIRA